MDNITQESLALKIMLAQADKATRMTAEEKMNYLKKNN